MKLNTKKSNYPRFKTNRIIIVFTVLNSKYIHIIFFIISSVAIYSHRVGLECTRSDVLHLPPSTPSTPGLSLHCSSIFLFVFLFFSSQGLVIQQLFSPYLRSWASLNISPNPTSPHLFYIPSARCSSVIWSSSTQVYTSQQFSYIIKNKYVCKLSPI